MTQKNLKPKKKYTWKLEIEIVEQLQMLAKKERRSLTSFVEILFIEKIEQSKNETL